MFPLVVRREGAVDPTPQTLYATPGAAAAHLAASPLDQQPVAGASARRRARENVESTRGTRILQTAEGTITRNFRTQELHVATSSVDLRAPMAPTTPSMSSTPSFRPPAASQAPLEEKEDASAEQGPPRGSSEPGIETEARGSKRPR